jgi:hypothetical protein
MPVVPTTAYAQAEDALNLARALVNDSAGVVFTDTLLMPLLCIPRIAARVGRKRRQRVGGAAGHRAGLEFRYRRDKSGNQRRFQPAASGRLPDAAHALGARHRKHHRRVRAHGEIHQRRRDAELATQHLFTAMGMARGQNKSDRRDAVHYCASALRKNLAAARAGDRSSPDSKRDRCFGICDCGAGCAISRSARAGCRPARLRADRCGKPNQSVCASGADKRTAPQALWISQPHYLFIDGTPLLIDDQRDGKSARCILRGALNGEICSAFRGDYDPRGAAVMTPAKYRDEKYE